MTVETKIFAATLADVQEHGMLTVQRGSHTVVLVLHDEQIYAVDNRCPHLGFPLDKGTVNDGLLICHWHHARFDLASGGTFDQWADDVRSFPVEMRGDQIWLDLAESMELYAAQQDRLRVGLERDISLVIGKAVLALVDNGGDTVEPFRTGLEFGTQYRQQGWGQGLTMHVCTMNMLPYLDEEDRPRALFQGLSAVARDSIGHPTRFCVRPLPGETADFATLKRWFRQFIEVRDSEGAERCVISALRAGAGPEEMADMLFAAATDHRYIDIGHPADFTNKALEALDIAGWALAETVLTSLVRNYAVAARMEESNAWRSPIDLVEILEKVFEALPDAVEMDREAGGEWRGRETLVAILLEDDPQTTVDAMLEALRDGCSMVHLAQTVSYAAALRVARFHTSNEFGDWDTALHTFTFANAVEQGLRRSPSVELLRGVFDAAMSVYLDRFLNIPAARIPEKNGVGAGGEGILDELITLLDRQQQVNQSAQQVATYLGRHNDPAALLARLGKLLLREDRNFHTIQCVEAAFRQYALLDGDSTAQTHVLIAAFRYLAAHSPTVRSQGQTYQIAWRLHQGDHLFEG